MEGVTKQDKDRQEPRTIIDRCNLTALLEPGQETTAQFLADHKVQVVASLPCYSPKNVNLQRGKGVFQKSIEALLMLNDLGYGKTDSGLELNLVYNPLGIKKSLQYYISLYISLVHEFLNHITVQSIRE